MWLLFLIAGLLSGSTPDLPETRWVRGSSDTLTVLAGYQVVGYRDAGTGGMDWTLHGDGWAGGWDHHQLWMVKAPMSARTTLPVASEAVAFMMDGDRNDGFATFLVDGQVIGTFDMYQRSLQSLIVEGLPMRRHTLEVRMEGTKRRYARADHIAMYGGSALIREVYAAK